MDVSELVHHIRRIAQEVVGRTQFKGTLVTTGYNPDLHAVKGMIMPHGIESGWVPIATVHTGENCGIVCGPNVGSAEALDGTVFAVHFDGGDPDTMVASGQHFSNASKPPRVESGELAMQHASGTRVFLDKDGQFIANRPDGSMVKLTKDGDVISMPAKGRMAYHGGDPGEGGTFDFLMTASGPSTNVKAKVG